MAPVIPLLWDRTSTLQGWTANRLLALSPKTLEVSSAALQTLLTGAACFVGYRGASLALSALPLYAATPAITITAVLVSTLAAAVFHSSEKIQNEYKIQRQLNTLIEVLGGKEKFNALPILSPEKVNEIHLKGQVNDPTTNKPRVYLGYLDSIKPEDVKMAPVTVGKDQLNRPFVTLCLKSIKDPKKPAFTLTLFNRHNPQSPEHWAESCHSNYFHLSKNGDRYGSLDLFVENLGKIINGGEHLGYKLVSPES